MICDYLPYQTINCALNQVYFKWRQPAIFMYLLYVLLDAITYTEYNTCIPDLPASLAQITVVIRSQAILTTLPLSLHPK